MMICDSFLSMTPYWKECRERSFNVTGANCSSWWHRKMAWGIMPHQILPAWAAPWYDCLFLNTVSQREKWGLGQDASCYFHSFFSLLGNSQRKKNHRLTETWHKSVRSFFSFSLSQALVCQKGIQREEKRAWQNRSTFSFCFCCLPVGTKLLISPATIYFLLL